MSLILRAGGNGNKKKRLKSSINSSYWIKNLNKLNNPLVTCNLFNKVGYNWTLYKKTYKCKE